MRNVCRSPIHARHAQAVLHVRRVKQGTPSTHPLTGRELRALQTDAIDISPGRLADPLTKPTKFRLRQEGA
jgi:hypothetical protein